MKYIKTYENYEEFKDLKIKDLKKYLLLEGDSGKLFVYEQIKIRTSQMFDEPVIEVLKIYDSESGMRAGFRNGVTNMNTNNLELRFRFIIKALVKHSDDVNELIEIAKRKSTQNRYNL